MSIAQISPNSIVAIPSQLTPYSQNVQHAATAQATQLAQSAVAKAKSDTVTISAQALKKNSKSRGFPGESREQDNETPVTRNKGRG